MLTLFGLYAILTLVIGSLFDHGGVAQLGECLTGSQKVEGSSPFVSTKREGTLSQRSFFDDFGKDNFERKLYMLFPCQRFMIGQCKQEGDAYTFNCKCADFKATLTVKDNKELPMGARVQIVKEICAKKCPAIKRDNEKKAN